MVDETQDVIVLIDEAATGAASTSPSDVATLREDGEAEDSLPPRAIEHRDGSIELPLLHPVMLKYRTKSSDVVREERVDGLVLHRLTGADMRAITAAAGDNQPVVALARSARIMPAKFGLIYDRMDGEDVNDAGQILGRFLGTGRKTGR